MEIFNASSKLKYSSQKIIVADKELITALDLKYFLGRLGLTVLPIINQGERLLNEVIEKKPGLIITDTQLDGKYNGVAAVIKLMKTMSIPYIFMTTSSNFNCMDFSDELNPLAVMQKPIDYTKLVFYINECLHPSFSESMKRINMQPVSSNC